MDQLDVFWIRYKLVILRFLVTFKSMGMHFYVTLIKFFIYHYLITTLIFFLNKPLPLQ